MLDPALRQYLDRISEHPMPHPSTISLDERRAYHATSSVLAEAPLEPMERVQNVRLNTTVGIVVARRYVPTNADPDTVAVYLHGGGFTSGTLDTYDPLARRLASALGITVLAVQYRLAPEHPFPAAVEDTVAAAEYVATHRGEFTSDTGKLVLIGDSAGGLLTAVAAQLLAARDVNVAVQVLLYPIMGPELLTESRHAFGTGYGLEMEHLNYYWEEFLGAWRDHTDPRVTPLLADNLGDVAPAVIVVAECDPLRDEAVNYAGLLEHFGVRVELLEATGMVHSFLRLGGVSPNALVELVALGEHVTSFLRSTD